MAGCWYSRSVSEKIVNVGHENRGSPQMGKGAEVVLIHLGVSSFMFRLA